MPSGEWSIRDAKAAALAESRALRTEAAVVVDLDGPVQRGRPPRWRWPLEPLLELGVQRSAPRRPDPFNAASDTETPDACELLARWLELDTSRVRQAAIEGLSDTQADRWAVRAGYHPANIWGWDAWATAGLDTRRVAHLVPEARRIAAAVAAAGHRVRKRDVIAGLRAQGVRLTDAQADALWQRLRAAVAGEPAA